MEKERIYEKAFEKWGADLQLLMVIEESAEVQQALTKLFRKGMMDNRSLTHLAEEVADLEIAIEQLKWYYSAGKKKSFGYAVNTFKKLKLERLEALVNAGD